ncbi:MAG: thiamine pyrophosphate-dependent dehydrogenase E1 component subunit alpha, partial [Bdellovibrionaceae bacterium]|nr:thiamine pyrophosphate-dependent dehydrogenase E1 component subunit alpha [Pseudobdellovibrionaceae bacterium]
SGANFITSEVDSLKNFEALLMKNKLISESQIKEVWQKYEEAGVKATEEARKEATPTSESIWDHIYYGNENADWRKF